jgi:uncharacterized protein YciI
MSEYIYLIHPYRQGFFESPTHDEEAIMAEHFNYLKQALQEGTLILAGPCTDDTFGLVVFHARDERAAREFMLSDPSVKKNVMAAELHPFHLSLEKQ